MELYIGPGLGGGIIAAVYAFLVGIVMLIIGFLFYPIKRLIQRFRKNKEELD